MIIIPTQLGISAFDISLSLDNVTFNLRFIWNSRENEWYMDIRDVDNISLILAVKLVFDYNMLAAYESIEGLPLGIFVFIQSSPDAVKTSENFGTDFLLTYFDQSEVLAAENGTL